jgi:hypothetical protein
MTLQDLAEPKSYNFRVQFGSVARYRGSPPARSTRVRCRAPRSTGSRRYRIRLSASPDDTWNPSANVRLVKTKLRRPPRLRSATVGERIRNSGEYRCVVYVCHEGCSCQSEFSGQRLRVKVGGGAWASDLRDLWPRDGGSIEPARRDYIIADEAAQDWPVANTGRDFPIIAREVQSALRKIAPAHRFSRAASATSS